MYCIGLCIDDLDKYLFSEIKRRLFKIQEKIPNTKDCRIRNSKLLNTSRLFYQTGCPMRTRKLLKRKTTFRLNLFL